MRITILGSGTSTGVPAVGCICRVCSSIDERDKRMRACALFETGGNRILVDTGPEFRIQALRAGISTLDAVLYTHNHADHINGIDDLRMISLHTGRAVECYGGGHTMAHLRQAFRYIWEAEDLGGGLPMLNLNAVSGEFEAGGVRITAIPVVHGKNPVFGYRIGKAAYLPDVKEIPEESLSRLGGLEILILDALRLETHPTHLCLSESIEQAKKIGAKRTYFTHIAHSLGLHAEVSRTLPKGMELAYDTLEIIIKD